MSRDKVESANTIALIACVKSKADSPAPAKELYLSPRFIYAREYVETQGWRWYVLSSLYGLIHPEQVVAPYDRSLVGAPRRERRNWANNVLRELCKVLQPSSRIVLLGGQAYTEFLAGPLREMGHIVEEPLAGLRQGEQLSRLRALATGSDRPEPLLPARSDATNRVKGRIPTTADIHPDVPRAREIAQRLYAAFAPGGTGVFGERSMPEDLLPDGVSQGSRDHIIFLTLTVSVDYMRDASDLWRVARRAWADEKTHYLFDPSAVERSGFERVTDDLIKAGIARRPTRDCRAWFAISRTLNRKWNADVREFLAACNFHGPTILARIAHDGQSSGSGWSHDFPLLRGLKIGSLWVRMLRDNAGIDLKGLEDVPLPVDVHVIRATLCGGAIRGRYSGAPEKLKSAVRDVWRKATEGLRRSDGGPMVALDIDEPLWTLSRLGCSRRGSGVLGPCPAGCLLSPGCVEGYISIKYTSCDFEIPV